MATYENCRIKELRMLDSFFKDCYESDRTTAIAGRFGSHSVFFGNLIQHNSFDIPYSAMKLIYEANKNWINTTLSNAESWQKNLENK